MQLTIEHTLHPDQIEQICTVDHQSMADLTLLPSQDLWSPAYVECMLDCPTNHFITASMFGKIVGFLYWRSMSDDATASEGRFIDWIAVSTGWRRNGIGTQLLFSFFEDCYVSQPAWISSIVRESCPEVLNLLSKVPARCGYTVKSQLKKDYWETGEDGIAFGFFLPPDPSSEGLSG